MILDSIITFLLITFSTLIGLLKTLTLYNSNKFNKYFFMALDSLVYIYVLKKITVNNEFRIVLIYVVAKTFSILMLDLIEDKVLKKIYLINLFLGDEFLEPVKIWLFTNNISFTEIKGNRIKSVDEKPIYTERNMLYIHINRKQKEQLFNFLHEIGIINPTYDVSNISVGGKIANRLK